MSSAKKPLAQLAAVDLRLENRRNLSESLIGQDRKGGPLTEGRQGCLDKAKKLTDEIGAFSQSREWESHGGLPMGLKASESIRLAIHEAADLLAREVALFLEEFAVVRKWWEELDTSRLFEHLDPVVWPQRPISDIADQGEVWEHRRAYCDAALWIVNGGASVAELDEMLDKYGDPFNWGRYITTITDIVTQGRARIERVAVADGPPAAGDDKGRVNGDDLMWVAAAAGGERGAQIVAIAQDKKLSVQKKLEAIYALDNTKLGWKSQQWAELFGVSRQAVEQTDWWQMTKPELEKDYR